MRRTKQIEPSLPPFRLLTDGGEGGEGGEGGQGGGGGGEGGVGSLGDWTSMVASLPAELREGVPDLGTSKDFPSFVTQYREKGKLIGQDTLALPAKDAPLDVTYEFFKKMGRPDKAEEYDLGEGFGPPENLPWDSESLPELLDVLHRAGLNNDQVKVVAGGYVEAAQKHFERMGGGLQEMYEDADRLIRREWGDQYEANMDLGHRAWKKYAGDDFEGIEATRLGDGRLIGDHPVLMRMMAEAGKLLHEHRLLGDAGGGGEGGRSNVTAIRGKIKELQASDKILNPTHPQNQDAVSQLNSLIEALGDEPLDPGQGDEFL